ncbi:putative monooxygenase [Tricladium varicosporioides]|nr:putative monooxygenase [Hymenoscyphus varicosporioides]
MFDFIRDPETGIKVIVVGTGFAGLTAAIECFRKGHSVLVLESFQERKKLGDGISFGPNSGRIFLSWPGMNERLEPITWNTDGLTIKSWKGEHILDQDFGSKEQGYGKNYNGHRGDIHEAVFNYATEIGIDIRLGHKVVDYFESDTEAGVVANGERFVGDVVLSGDGVRSLGRTIVLGHEDKPKPSGYAIYRAWFDASALQGIPDFEWMFTKGQEICAWIGPDIHFIIATTKKHNDLSWVCTHKDDKDVEEGWMAEAPIADARKHLEGWDPLIHKILDATPDPIIDWKLVYRDPLPTWISPKRRTAVIGDAAHPFLPTSIQGASQAMEDGTTLAVCLQKSGKERVQEALQVFEALRYERVRAAQKTGETTRDIWHKADWNEVKKNPESIKLRREEWLLNFDSEKYAEDHYAATAALLDDPEAARQLNAPKID